MKKSLVLAMAMALGVTASAYAANPFSDVPAGHWAYDSVAKLAAAGVVDGYADGAFDGDKLMTRYEMAQIVAKAMAKGADCDKLAAEFADELDTLGVRVAKLEKGADAVKIAGQIRASFKDDSDGSDGQSRLRTRLIVKGAINDGWTYTGRFENNQYMDGSKGSVGEDEVKLNWAYVSGKIGGVKVDMGRQDFKVGEGFVVDSRHDGVKAQYGKDIKLTVWAGKGSDDIKKLSPTYEVDSGETDDNGGVIYNDVAHVDNDDRAYYADLATKVGVVGVNVDYYKLDANKAADKEVWAVGASLPLAKGLKLAGQYLMGDEQAGKDDTGYTLTLAFGGASAAKPGSWGLYANYFDQPDAVELYSTIRSYADIPEGKEDGFKGYRIGANYAVAKNIVAQVEYYDLEDRENSKDTEETLWGQVTFTF